MFSRFFKPISALAMPLSFMHCHSREELEELAPFTTHFCEGKSREVWSPHVAFKILQREHMTLSRDNLHVHPRVVWKFFIRVSGGWNGDSTEEEDYYQPIRSHQNPLDDVFFKLHLKRVAQYVLENEDVVNPAVLDYIKTNNIDLDSISKY